MYNIDLRIHFLYTVSMIHSYSCKNFFSINDTVEVHFDVNEKAPDSTAYVMDIDRRLSVVEAIVGPNASGKTQTVKALAFLRHLIAEMSDSDDDDDIPVSSFRDNNEPTEVQAEFSINNRLYRYYFKLTNERILKEELKERTQSSERKTFKSLLSREWINGEYEVNTTLFSIPKSFSPRRNSSMISQIWRAYNDEEAGVIIKYWRDCIVTNVWVYGNHDDYDQTRLHHGDVRTRRAIREMHKHPRILELAKDLLQKMDIGFLDFEEVESLAKETKEYRVRHKYGDDEFTLDPRYESSGTKRSILMLWYILKTLDNKNGAIAALDEFDAYLHPDIVETLVKLFISPVTNPNGSQLVFSSHSHQLLAELDKQQIILVEKNSDGATDVWRLDEVTGVRSDDNYYNKYIAGAYGAKHKIWT